jgi:NAD(P)-dependent dehydrogenase (short-subunit alcohol dehydrogenase family)
MTASSIGQLHGTSDHNDFLMENGKRATVLHPMHAIGLCARQGSALGHTMPPRTHFITASSNSLGLDAASSAVAAFFDTVFDRTSQFVGWQAAAALFATVTSASIVHVVSHIRRNSIIGIDYSKHVVVITGCDSGFGAAACVQLKKLGFFVIATTITTKGYQELQEKVSMVVMCDVTKDEQVAVLGAAVEKVVRGKGLKLWAVINNAGIAPMGYLDWLPLASYQKSMDVNYFGIIRVVKATLPLLKETKYSRVVNVCSVAGLTGGPAFSAYSGSKHAVEGLAKCLRSELYPWNISVSNINPTFMRTPIINSNLDLALKEFNAAPEAVKNQYSETILTEIFTKVDYLLEVRHGMICHFKGLQIMHS